MLLLEMAAARTNEPPAITFDQPDNFADLH
jgi:hypothetical protein